MSQLKRYSSCDACRRWRLGCNASSQGGGPCFNCARKGIVCTSTQNQRNKMRAKERNLHLTGAQTREDAAASTQTCEEPEPLGIQTTCEEPVSVQMSEQLADISSREQPAGTDTSERTSVLSDSYVGEQNVSTSFKPLVPASEPYFQAQYCITKAQQALQLHQILWNIFTALLEPRIGLWIGGSCCPFRSSKTVSLLHVESARTDIIIH